MERYANAGEAGGIPKLKDASAAEVGIVLLSCDHLQSLSTLKQACHSYIGVLTCLAMAACSSSSASIFPWSTLPFVGAAVTGASTTSMALGSSMWTANA